MSELSERLKSVLPDIYAAAEKMPADTALERARLPRIAASALVEALERADAQR